MTVKLETEHHLEILSLKGGCIGSSESKLVKMPHCRKSHVAARLWMFYLLPHLQEIIGNPGVTHSAGFTEKPGNAQK